MFKITRIVQQKQKERANIFLDGKFAFSLSLEQVLKKGLKSGAEITEENVKRLEKESGEEKIFLRAIEFGMRRPRSEREFNLWFRRKKVEESLQGETLQKLTNLGLVNDLAFAKWWVEQRSFFRPKSRRVLKLELAQKGISREIIDEVLQDKELPSEDEQILKIAQKRWERLKNLEPRTRKQKLSEFLARRGFSWDNIKEAIRKIDSKGDLG